MNEYFPEIKEYFGNPANVFGESNYDYTHFAAALGAMNNLSPVDLGTYLKAELSSWGGDLQTITGDLELINLHGSLDYYELKSALREIGYLQYGNRTTFPKEDLIQDIDAFNMHYYGTYSYSSAYVRYARDDPAMNRKRMFVEAYGRGNYDVGLSKLKRRAEYLLVNHGQVNGMKRPYDPTELEKQVIIDMLMEELTNE